MSKKKKTWLRKILSGSGATEKVAQKFYRLKIFTSEIWQALLSGSNLWNDGYVTLNGFVSCFFFLCKCIVQPRSIFFLKHFLTMSCNVSKELFVMFFKVCVLIVSNSHCTVSLTDKAETL